MSEVVLSLTVCVFSQTEQETEMETEIGGKKEKGRRAREVGVVLRRLVERGRVLGTKSLGAV